jgi:hypothetical protein
MLDYLVYFAQKGTFMPDRPSTAWLPRKFEFWPEDKEEISPIEVVKMYGQGYAGAWADEEADKEWKKFIEGQEFGVTDGKDALQIYGLAGAGEGKLVLPFQLVEKLLPGCWPGAAQQVGDCVSHSTKNAVLVTMCGDILSGKPDEETGKLEGLPDIPATGIKQGALSSEAIYWWRGYNGHGWSCGTAARVACTKAGLWLRKEYPDLDIDLTTYSGKLASKYGKNPPPDKILNYGKNYLIRTSTRCDEPATRRDLAFNGYGISACGSQGWSSKRDDNGFSRRQGSWAHAMAEIGYDDRPIFKEKYGDMGILILNSWGKWNTGGRKIIGTDIEIPEGSFWALASDCRGRDCYAFSGAMGWPAKNLPDLSTIPLG